MELDLCELDLYNDYMNYLREDLSMSDIEWLYNIKWCVLIDNKPKEVISYHNWKKMVEREEKLKRLLE